MEPRNEEVKYEVRRDIQSPQGGWKYTVPETGVTVRGEFFKDLYQKVRNHYVANGLEAPDKEDVQDGACRETNPGGSWCGKKPPKPVAGALPHLTLAHVRRFLETMMHVIRARKFVSREEALRRIDICRGNPEKGIEPCKAASSIGGCLGCAGIEKLIKKLTEKNPIPDDDPDKRFCLCCGCHLSSKVLIPNDLLDKAEKVRPKYEPNCWRLEANRGEALD